MEEKGREDSGERMVMREIVGANGGEKNEQMEVGTEKEGELEIHMEERQYRREARRRSER